MLPMQILTMEYVPGIKINKIQALDQLGVDRKSLVQSLFICWQNHYESVTVLPFTFVLLC